MSYVKPVTHAHTHTHTQARKAIALRSTMERKLANIEREKKEDTLRQLAQKARDARVGIRAPANEGM